MTGFSTPSASRIVTVLEAGDFFHWEGVHVCPEENGLAGPIPEDAGETEAADVGVDVEGI